MVSAIVKLCDPHMATDVKVDGATHEVKIDGVTYELDLCTEDYDTHVKPLLALITEHGRRVGAPETGGRGGGATTSRCPICNDNKSPLTSAHTRKLHNMSPHETLVAAGLAEPSESICYLCSPKSDLGSGQGLAAHGRSIHGLNTKDFKTANDKAKAETGAEQQPATSGQKSK